MRECCVGNSIDQSSLIILTLKDDFHWDDEFANIYNSPSILVTVRSPIFNSQVPGLGNPVGCEWFSAAHKVDVV